MATIKDVALRAGVSVTTVSHVVNGTRHVSPDGRERVEQAIRALGYVPSAVARSLKRNTTHTLGMITPNSSNPYFAEIVRAVEDRCFGAGYTLILCNTDDEPRRQSMVLQVLAQRRIDGLIVVDMPPEEADELAPFATAQGLDLIRLIAPTTDDARLPYALDGAGGRRQRLRDRRRAAPRIGRQPLVARRQRHPVLGPDRVDRGARAEPFRMRRRHVMRIARFADAEQQDRVVVERSGQRRRAQVPRVVLDDLGAQDELT